MQQWVQLVGAKPCGRCGQRLDAGTTVLLLSSPTGGWKKIRCATCAGREVPSLDQIRLIAPPVTTQDVKDRFAHVASLAKQFPRQQREKPKPVLVKPKRAYRGEDDFKMRQGKDMFDDLPRYDR